MNCMASLLSSLNASQPIDEELGVILENVVQRIERGQAVDLDAIAAAHPAYASQLRELVPAAQTLVRMGNAERAGAASAPDALPTPYGHNLEPVRQLGDFRIIRELGRGGMGTVFEAEQLTMGRRVALKVLPFAALAREKSLQRFRNEVRAAAALDHPNIVSVYSVGEERGIHYFAMQLIRGQTLADYVASQKASRSAGASGLRGNENPTIDSRATAPTTTAVEQAHITTVLDSRRTAEQFRYAARLGIQAADALQHAHDQGVLHRDVKPGNLLLDGDGKLYITDFGLARIEADAGITMTGDIIGTLRYMAPEQALAKRVVIDHRADIYSLGATLYEVLTLEAAFGESGHSDLLKQIAFEEPRPLRRLDHRLPADLEVIVLKAMAKNPNERYETAQALADDLRAFLDDRAIRAKAPAAALRLAKWARRHRSLVVLSGVATAAILLTSMLFLTWSNRAIMRERDKTIAALSREVQLARASDAKAKLAYCIELCRAKQNVAAERLLDEIPKEFITEDVPYAQMQAQFGWSHAIHEEWAEARNSLDKMLRWSSKDQERGTMEGYLYGGPVFSKPENSSVFQDFADAAIARRLNATDPVFAEQTCRMCLLKPADDALLRRLDQMYDLVRESQRDVGLIEKAVLGVLPTPGAQRMDPQRVAFYRDFGALALALVDYRRGDFASSLKWCEGFPRCQLETPALVGATVAAHAVAAMDFHRLGRESEARTSLAVARAVNQAPEVGLSVSTDPINRGAPPPIFFVLLYDRVYGDELLREAESLVDEASARRTLGCAAAQNLAADLYGSPGYFGDVENRGAAQLHWRRKAADQGFAAAQLHLAHCYARGLGVERNSEKASQWRRRALGQFAWTCNLSPDAIRLLNGPLKSAGEFAEKIPDAKQFATLGAIHYRAGNWELALRHLTQAMREYAERPAGRETTLPCRVLLAMIKWRQGQSAEASRQFIPLQREIEATLESSSTDWNARATLVLYAF